MSLFLDACLGRPTSKTPVWLMRQAGRYQPEYRAIREKVSFLELCRSPSLCSEVAVRAVEQLDADAAIVFADILLVLEPLGIGFEFTKDDGPRIEFPVREPGDVARVKSEIDARGSLGYVMEAVRTTKKDLGGRVPLLGFSGAPFTLASYVIEGGGSRDYHHTKRFMYSHESAWHDLLHKLTSAVIAYLEAQIDAGAEAFQLFDSWIGALGPEDYRRYVLPHSKRIFDTLSSRVPSIHFGTGNPALYPLLVEAGGHVLGVDHRASLADTWRTTSASRAHGIQGNLDSVALLGDRATWMRKVDALLEAVGTRPGHIFNLGHGVLPPTQPADARALVDYVHEQSERIRAR